MRLFIPNSFFGSLLFNFFYGFLTLFHVFIIAKKKSFSSIFLSISLLFPVILFISCFYFHILTFIIFFCGNEAENDCQNFRIAI